MQSDVIARRRQRKRSLVHASVPELPARVQHRPTEARHGLIYLDQLAVSDMMKAINPNLEPERKARVLPFWEELFRLLDRLRSLQLIACPQSDFHEEESAVAPMREDLRQVYQHLSADVRFRDADWIRSSQVFDQVVSWATGKDTRVVNLDRRRVLHGDPSAWTDLYRVSIAMRDPDGYVTELRRSRNARAKSVSPTCQHP
jgi:hypothetical protein